MTFYASGPLLGANLTDFGTTQLYPLGTITQGKDATYGVGEFIYLKGIGSTVAGSWVSYDQAGTTAFLSALHSTALSKPRSVAVAMSACVASNYGWYQISGIATVVKANTVSYAAAAALAASAGNAIAAASGLMISGALVAIVASAKSDVTSVKVMINRPHGPRN